MTDKIYFTTYRARLSISFVANSKLLIIIHNLRLIPFREDMKQHGEGDCIEDDEGHIDRRGRHILRENSFEGEGDCDDERYVAQLGTKTQNQR